MVSFSSSHGFLLAATFLILSSNTSSAETEIEAASADDHPCGWRRGAKNGPDVYASGVADQLRHGILPTKATYPKAASTESSPQIDLSTTQAPKPYLADYNFDDEYCHGFGAMNWPSFSSWPMSYSRDNQQAALQYAGLLYKAMPRSESLPYAAEFLAYTTPSWNQTYYQSVLPALEAQSTRNGGDGCVKPYMNTHSVMFGQSWMLGTTARDKTPCRTYTDDFVRDYNQLPTTLEGNEQAYIDFCQTYGFHFPVGFRYGYHSTQVQIFNTRGEKTNYYLGHAGSLYESPEECEAPIVTSFRPEGWHKIESLTAEPDLFSTTTARNFEKFYKHYPLSENTLPEGSPEDSDYWKAHLLSWSQEKFSVGPKSCTDRVEVSNEQFLGDASTSQSTAQQTPGRRLRGAAR